jgi:hypothetical protein
MNDAINFHLFKIQRKEHLQRIDKGKKNISKAMRIKYIEVPDTMAEAHSLYVRVTRKIKEMQK